MGGDGTVAERKRSTVRDLRRDNRSVLLWSLFIGQPCSRQDLSWATGLSTASVSNVVREFIDEGIVTEAGSVDSDGGRPRALLQMDPDYGRVIGVDVGETRIRVEMFDMTMELRASADYALDAQQQGMDVVVDRVNAGLASVLADGGVDPWRCSARASGCPGSSSTRARRAWSTRRPTAGTRCRLAGCCGGRLPALHRERGQDDRQAELWFGGGRGARQVVGCLMGSGLGATSSPAPPAGAAPPPRSSGGTPRSRSAGGPAAAAPAAAWRRTWGPGRSWTGTGARCRARTRSRRWPPWSRPGDARSAEILDETALYLGAGIADLVNLFGPERIILGGWAGLLLGERLLPAIREAAREHSLTHQFAQTSIELGQPGPGRGGARAPPRSRWSASSTARCPPGREISRPAEKNAEGKT